MTLSLSDAINLKGDACCSDSKEEKACPYDGLPTLRQAPDTVEKILEISIFTFASQRQNRAKRFFCRNASRESLPVRPDRDWSREARAAIAQQEDPKQQGGDV